MEGITVTPEKIWLEKPYLSIPGIDLFGHAKFRRAAEPLSVHSHKDCIELVFVIKGQQVYEIEGQQYQVGGGEVFLSCLDQPHRSEENCQGVGEFYWMQLNLSQPEDFLGLGPAFSLDLAGRLAELRQHVFPFSPEMKSLVKQAFDRFYKLGAVPLSVSTLVFLLQTMLHGLQEQQLDTDHFLELGQYIESHLTDNLTIEDLSRACCISVSTLQHKFKDYFGRTPAEYINYRKIERSKELLLSGKSITQTAMLLEFNTSDYFSTVFRKFNGMSPSQWLIKKRKA